MQGTLERTSMGQIRWRLRQIMADRKISNKDLSEKIGTHHTTISRLKSKDTLPAIGGEEVEKIRDGINALSASSHGICRLQDLIQMDESSEN